MTPEQMFDRLGEALRVLEWPNRYPFDDATEMEGWLKKESELRSETDALVHRWLVDPTVLEGLPAPLASGLRIRFVLAVCWVSVAQFACPHLAIDPAEVLIRAWPTLLSNHRPEWGLQFEAYRLGYQAGMEDGKTQAFGA